MKRYVNENPFSRLFDTISACMKPVIPILMAAGILKLLIILIGYTGLFTLSPQTEDVLSAVSNAAFYFLYWDGKLAGYLKLNEASAQTDLHDEQSLEIERIYVSKEFQGEGLGRYLMDQAISIAIQRKKKYVWLGVWEKNEKALRFYRRNGFYQIGTHSFVMCDDEQTDYIMRKDLEG